MTLRREDQFSYIVSSDGCMDIFPENHASNFKIMFKDPIEFKSDEDWEVGLIDLHYPYSWYNVSSDMVMFYSDGAGVGHVEFPDWQCIKLGDLINNIQDQLSSQYVVKVDQFGRFQLEGKGTCCDVGFSSGLISLLGLPAYDNMITIASFRRRAGYREVFEEFWENGENPLDKDEHLFVIDWTSTKDREILKILEEYLDKEKLKCYNV
jgi:hypothetical protein